MRQEIELQSYLNELIERDIDRRVAEFLVIDILYVTQLDSVRF
jgi:hypothetical protein